MLKATEVRKTFGSLVALEGLDLTVQSGETVCLLGANGAGKSTTMNLFLGFLTPDSGEITVEGLSPTDKPKEVRQQIAYIPENVALYPALSGLENLRIFDQLGGRKNSDKFLTSHLVEAGLRETDLSRPVEHYSKGMRQKVGLAIAFAKGAKVMLMDEPMSGLDPQAANEFTSRIQLLTDLGCAVLIATHDIFRAKECASRIGIMRSGQLVEEIIADEVNAQEIERIYLSHMQEGVTA